MSEIGHEIHEIQRLRSGPPILLSHASFCSWDQGDKAREGYKIGYLYSSFFFQISVKLLRESHSEKESFFFIQNSLFCFCTSSYTYIQTTPFRMKEYFVSLSGRALFK